MPVHHVKGQPAAPTYAQKKGGSLFTLIMKHPVDIKPFFIAIHYTDEIAGPQGEEITVRHEENGDIIATSTQTLKDPDGTVRTVHKVERLREDSKGMSVAPAGYSSHKKYRQPST